MNDDRKLYACFALFVSSPILCCALLFCFTQFPDIVTPITAPYEVDFLSRGLAIPSTSKIILSLEGRYVTGNDDCFLYDRLRIYEDNQLSGDEILKFYTSSLDSKT